MCSIHKHVFLSIKGANSWKLGYSLPGSPWMDCMLRLLREEEEEEDDNVEEEEEGEEEEP